MVGRFISLLISIVCLIIFYFFGGSKFVFVNLISLILPLGCIWFGDELGGYVGPAGHSYINSESPGFIVRFAGWILFIVIIGRSFFIIFWTK